MLAAHESNHRIEIENQSFEIKRCDYNHLPYDMLRFIRKSLTTPMAPFQIDRLLLQPDVEKTPTDILNIEDNCLCEILKRLSLLDLLTVSKTCKQLCQIAKTVFELKYKKKHIKLRDLKQNGEAMTNIEHLLNNFGSSISSLGLDDGIGDGNKIFGLIGQHCGNLKTLSVDGILMRKVNIGHHSQVYGRLETLGIVGGFLAVNEVLAACHQLKELDGMMIDCLDLTHVPLPSLVTLKLRFFKCAGMGEFLIRHPNIEKLEMQMPDPIVSDSLSNDVDQFMFDHLPNIREVEMFEISNDKISKLSEMRNLKSVYLDFDMKPIARAMKTFSTKNTPIETLELARGFIDDSAIGYICKMKTIKVFNLFQCNGFDENFLDRLLLHLPNLKRMCDSSGSLLDVDRILPMLKDKRVEWLNEISRDDDSFVSYVR